MGFPGRLKEKKRHPVKLYLFSIGTIMFIMWGVWVIANTLLTPLKPQTQQDHSFRESPSIIERKTDQFNKDVNQILRGEPFQRRKGRADSGNAVTYDTVSENAKAVNKPDPYYQ